MKWERSLLLGVLLISFKLLETSCQSQYAGNPYLNGIYTNDINTFLADQIRQNDVDLSTNVFLKRMISGSTEHIKRDAIFSAPGYLPPINHCSDMQFCVQRDLCLNGYFEDYQLISPKRTQACNEPTEVCCRILEPESTVLTENGYVVRVPKKQFSIPGSTSIPNLLKSDEQNHRPQITPEGIQSPLSNTGQKESKPLSSTYKPLETFSKLPKTTARPFRAKQTTNPYAPQDASKQHQIPREQESYTSQQTGGPHQRKPDLYQPSGNLVTSSENSSHDRLPQSSNLYPLEHKQVPINSPLRTYNLAYLPPDRVPQASVTHPTRVPPSQKPVLSGEAILSQPIYPGNQLEEIRSPSRCAAALNCTEIQFCTANGIISKTPVMLTKDQEVYRVPLTDCRDEQKGFVGKCCRDPNYVDPWPVTQLGRYDAALFGDDGSYKPSQKNGKKKNQLAQPSILTGQAILSLPITNNKLGPSSICTTRNYNGSPKGQTIDDADFSEFPWQAMILLESTKSLLCGGAILAVDLVLTTAECVIGFKPFDVLIKGGEWKLGRDEEPLTFQINRVKTIEVHPLYRSNREGNNLAALHLDTNLKLAPHIAPICFDEFEPSAEDECVTTGWGKDALRLHKQDAVMKKSLVTLMTPEKCNMSSESFQQKGGLCGLTYIDPCKLDPGSALVCANKRGHYILKGIYSTVEKCGEGNTVIFNLIDSKWINHIAGGRKATVLSEKRHMSSIETPVYLPPTL